MAAKRTAQAEQLARVLATQASTIDHLNSLFRGMMKSALECLLDAEMDAHHARPGTDAPRPLEPHPARRKRPKTAATASPRRPSRANGATSPWTARLTAKAPSTRSSSASTSAAWPARATRCWPGTPRA